MNNWNTLYKKVNRIYAESKVLLRSLKKSISKKNSAKFTPLQNRAMAVDMGPNFYHVPNGYKNPVRRMQNNQLEYLLKGTGVNLRNFAKGHEKLYGSDLYDRGIKNLRYFKAKIGRPHDEKTTFEGAYLNSKIKK